MNQRKQIPSKRLRRVLRPHQVYLGVPGSCVGLPECAAIWLLERSLPLLRRREVQLLLLHGEGIKRFSTPTAARQFYNSVFGDWPGDHVNWKRKEAAGYVPVYACLTTYGVNRTWNS